MKKRKSKRWLLFILAGIAAIAAAIYIYLPDFLDNLRSAQTYDDLRDSYVEAPEGDGGEEKEDWWLTDVFVNFEELRGENEDIIAWIRSDNPEETQIDYPVLYSGENTEYLRKDLYGNEHTAGSIFLEGLNQPDFSDYYSIIYGHNMRDGSMFGSLDKYKEQSFWSENQYFTLYTENMVYRYQVFACQNAVNGGDVYKIGYEPGEEYQEFLDGLSEDSLIDTGIHPDSSHKVMTLSTCTGDGYSRRFAVHAVCVDAQGTDTAGEQE